MPQQNLIKLIPAHYAKIIASGSITGFVTLAASFFNLGDYLYREIQLPIESLLPCIQYRQFLDGSVSLFSVLFPVAGSE